MDGQGSCMEIAEWVGSSPAERVGGSINFNGDTGGVFSYTDLYLMGYVSAEEMDAGNSELRHLEDNDGCGSPYGGPISEFSSADIVAAAGPRDPDWTEEDRDYKTAWIMFHLPGAPPAPAQLDKAVGILEQHEIDWNASTLGRGTMDNSLFPDCNCNGVPDATDIRGGASDDENGNGIPDECECIGDVDGDGTVDVDDLVAVVLAWGEPGGPADVNGDGTVDVDDLVAVILKWGPC